MNFSESTFILPSEAAGTDVRMRIFTPANELPMAGHPTIGSTFALAHTGTIGAGSSRFVFGLGVGPVPVYLEWEGDRLRFAWMTQLKPVFGPAIDARDAVAAAIGLGTADLAPDLPIQQVSTGLPFLFVPTRSHEVVDRASCDVSISVSSCSPCCRRQHPQLRTAACSRPGSAWSKIRRRAVRAARSVAISYAMGS
jgi:trans-2,3-dihydro-3-hydroxyanthranilate isomerase